MYAYMEIPKVDAAVVGKEQFSLGRMEGDGVHWLVNGHISNHVPILPALRIVKWGMLWSCRA
jgi:hypothetical protein